MHLFHKTCKRIAAGLKQTLVGKPHHSRCTIEKIPVKPLSPYSSALAQVIKNNSQPFGLKRNVISFVN